MTSSIKAATPAIQITSCDVPQYMPTQARPFWYPCTGLAYLGAQPMPRG